jgi:hypothetical protein
MKRIGQFLRNLWRKREPDSVAYGRTRNAKDNKILDEWLKEHKGRSITHEAFEEYRRRVLESAGKNDQPSSDKITTNRTRLMSRPNAAFFREMESSRVRNRSWACLMLPLVLCGFALIQGQAGALSQPHQQPTSVAEPYVQITSVTIDPPRIHRSEQPSKARIIVQFLLQGEAPADSTARIDIGTYSYNPPGNKVSYDNQSRTVSLKERLTTAEFTVESTPETVAGKVVVAATIFKTTKGINIKPPDEPNNWHAEFSILDP